MKLVLVIAAVAMSSALLVPTVAQAATQEYEQVSTTVFTRSGESQADFQRRLNSAIRKMCSEGRERLLALGPDTDRCIAGAKAQLQRELAAAPSAPRS
ncbi:MAG TPA: hypothetical protein VFK58_05995 [Sphingomicrobium sp.]|nr:hypothetical protein [Sphingomicrobium sp.]